MRISIILALALMIAAPGWAAQQSTAKYKAPNGGTIQASAAEIEGIGPNAIRVVLRNQARITITNPGSEDSVDAQAGTIELVLYADSKNAPGGATVKSAHLIGSPKIVHKVKDSAGNIVTTIATGKDATYTGETQSALLKGDVRITSQNGMKYENATMTGDEATVNLKPNLGPEDTLFKISSSPGVSKLEVTPKPKTEAESKQ